MLMMSVSGVRGVIGESLTPALAADLGCAFGTLLGARASVARAAPGGPDITAESGCAPHTRPPLVVIGRDSRPSGPMIQQAVVSGLLATGCRVVLLDVASTPATALMVRQHHADGGIVITASHNPITWNGIKFLTADGVAPPPDQAEQLFDIHRRQAFKLVDVRSLHEPVADDLAAAAHVEAVLMIVDPPLIGSRGFRVVLDSVNGAGGGEGRLLLDLLGCEVVHINGEPTGWFAHTPEPLAENLTQLCEAVREERADCGFAQDPDADRLAIVDGDGRYIGEEYTLALAARYMFSARPGPAAANLSTSRMIDDLAAATGGPCRVHRSSVGEANVVEAMRRHACTIGGEGNGGVIDPRVVPVRDSLVAMALVLQLMAETGKSIAALVAEMPRYVMIKEKFQCSKDRIDEVLAAVLRHYSELEKNSAFRVPIPDASRGIADESEIGNRKAEIASPVDINDADGVRIDFPDGWVHVRGSNTEPIIRIIAEAPTAARAEALISAIREIAAAIS